MAFLVDDQTLRSRVPSASGALLSAALGGLLCLTPSCHSDSNGTPDTGTNVDGATGSDAQSAADAQPDVALDAVTADAGRDAAADAVADATAVDVASDDATSLDAAAADATSDDAATMDATIADAASDDAATLDVAIGVDAIPPCDIAPDRVITYSDAATDVTVESFTALCATRGGHVEVAPHCGGFNTCAGFSYDQTQQTYTEHTCAGLNTCTGYSCVIP